MEASQASQAAQASQVSQATGNQARVSSGSARAPGSRSTNPDKQISQIEKSVTHLLVATKQLLETLTQWSRGNAQEEEVSDVYVRLGYEFNLACRAFHSIGVDTSDLGPVPDLLRTILEDTLSQPASPQALDNYLPRIRDIIINLLHGLKRKQSKLRSRPPRDGSSKPQGAPPRQTSLSSVQESEASVGTGPEATPAVTPGRSDSRAETLRFFEEPQSTGEASSVSPAPPAPPFNRNSLSRSTQRTQPRQAPAPEAAAQGSGPGSQSLPTISTPQDADHAGASRDVPFPYAPPPPPKQDALTALQRGPDLERRASRRFSAYQIQKHLGGSTNGIPVIPPAQNSPIPNRGREAKESLTAVRSRASFHSKKSASRLQEISPNRNDSVRAPQRISEERDDISLPQLENGSRSEQANADSQHYSPTVQTPDEYIAANASQPVVAATLSGPMSPPGEFHPEHVLESDTPMSTVQDDNTVTPGTLQKPSMHVPNENRITATPSPTVVTNFDSSPQGKELTLFLQYKSKIKKFCLSEGFDGLTMARLQLAFIEKFAWNTHNNGVDLPEIYIQDPVSGVRHELEDLSDVKDRCVLVLNVEVLDEVKKHFDEGIGGLKTTLESVRSLLDGQGSVMQRVSDRQLETSKEMARLSTVQIPRPGRAKTTGKSPVGSSTSTEASFFEIQSLRRDIAVLRQTYSTMSNDFAATMTDIKAKAAAVKEAAATAVAPSYEGDAGRAHVNQGKKVLSTDSESLVNRVDDLTDVVEDLRKDVVTRGVRPLPRQLEEISKEITTTSRMLNKMKEFMKREKPIWTKIWEKELDQVCTERDDLTQQEELMSDLDGDLQDLTGVFKLVEEAMKQQSLQAPGNSRNASRQFDFESGVDPQAAKDGMLDEVRALKPNHESRLEAIERAEKARRKELETRSDGEFKREVKEFVEEGKLRKTGGMDEVERLRKVRDKEAMKENWERQQAREVERERKRQADAAAKAAAAAEAAAREAAVHESSAPAEDSSTADGKSTSNEVVPADPANENGDFIVPSTGTSPVDHIHQGAALPTDHAVNTGRTSSELLVDGEPNEKQTNGPPQIRDGGLTDNSEEVHETDSKPPEPSNSTAKDNSWWKPAIF